MSALPRELLTPVRWETLDEQRRRALLERPAVNVRADVEAAVRDIVTRVRADGDTALLALTAKFDGVELETLRVTDEEFDAAERALRPASLAAIDTAIANVRRFHAEQRQPDVDIETIPGVRCQRVSHAIDAVGLYVPAGSAPLPSAAIMLAVPAAIAGCRRRVLCTPPRPDGDADAAVLVAARRAGVAEVYKVGGAQAIAALAYGTASIARVDKIFGPGNAYVTAAKSLVAADAGGTAVDMPAGPSEVLVIADDGARADFVAADLLSQAEHGPDSQVVLLTTSAALAAAVLEQIDVQLGALDRRDIAAQALAHSRLVVCDDLATAASISNRYAPEHLIVQTAEPRRLLPSLRNAGSIFLGPYTPESVGDYASGTNHVLPTYGAARAYSGLGVDDFMRRMTIQELTADGLRALAPSVTELARLEGLDAHAAAVTIRLARQPGDEA